MKPPESQAELITSVMPTATGMGLSVGKGSRVIPVCWENALTLKALQVDRWVTILGNETWEASSALDLGFLTSLVGCTVYISRTYWTAWVQESLSIQLVSGPVNLL